MVFRNLIQLSNHIVLRLWNEWLLKLHEESFEVVGHDVWIFDKFEVGEVALAHVYFKLPDFGVRANHSKKPLREKSSLFLPEVTSEQPKNGWHMIAAKLWSLSEFLQMLPKRIVCVDHFTSVTLCKLWTNSVS